MSNLIQTFYQRSVMLKAAEKYYDARPLAQQYLELSRKTHGEVHPEVGLALANLASIFQGMQQTVEALDCYEKSLAVREKLYDHGDHAEIADCLQNIALLLHELGRYQQVLVYFERSLEMKKRMNGENHPAVATDLNVLGVLLIKQTRYELAATILKRSLAIREKVFGDAHPLVATALNNLATLLEKQNKFEEAEPFFSRALIIRETNLGHEHKHTIHSKNNLSDMIENKELACHNKKRTEELQQRSMSNNIRAKKMEELAKDPIRRNRPSVFSTRPSPNLVD